MLLEDFLRSYFGEVEVSESAAGLALTFKTTASCPLDNELYDFKATAVLRKGDVRGNVRRLFEALHELDNARVVEEGPYLELAPEE